MSLYCGRWKIPLLVGKVAMPDKVYILYEKIIIDISEDNYQLSLLTTCHAVLYLILQEAHYHDCSFSRTAASYS